ncbi:NAD(P)/FAD-dependent oxidoreductase [Ammoniphilus sp. 3BR4]|uniref:NAD(P)/FAD-dependent oxidoreductase n=1 Tax=Ammoniphilus sp. 3BR4 TaxID=3158265 RepID=UPI00346667E6
MKKQRIIVVGGGLAGIMAASTLQEKGIKDILIVEEGSVIGGRMATKGIGKGRFDYGAQFFTVRSPRLQLQAEEWLGKGWIKRWFGDAYPRYTSMDGMQSLAAKLAEGLPLRLETKVKAVREARDGLEVELESREKLLADGVILTPPAPSTQVILRNGGISFQQGDLPLLLEQKFNPCFVALLQYSKSTKLEYPGHLDQGITAEIERIVDHEKKGISPVAAVSVYMTGEWSRANFEKTDEQILDSILEVAGSHLAMEGPIEKQLMRWNYAEAVHIARKPFLDGGLSHPLLIAGDAYLSKEDPAGRTRLESAFLSGVSAGEEMGKKLLCK